MTTEKALAAAQVVLAIILFVVAVRGLRNSNRQIKRLQEHKKEIDEIFKRMKK